MKNTFLTLAALALLLAAAPAARAQTMPAAPATSAAPAMSAPATPAMTTRKAMVYKAAPAAERAARMSQEIGKQLGLDAATTAKVQAVALTRCQKIDDIQNGAASNKEKGQALEVNAKEFKAALQGILTPAQFAQYTSKADHHKGKMAGPMTTPAAN